MLYTLVVSVCLAASPNLMCKQVPVGNVKAESRLDCREKTDKYIKRYFTENPQYAYRGHRCNPVGDDI